MKKNFILGLALCCIQLFGTSMSHAQELEDSLLQVISNATHDTTRANVYLELVEEVYFSNKEKAEEYNEQAFKIASSQLNFVNLDPAIEYSFKATLGDAYTNRGFMANRRGEVKLALKHYDAALRIQESINEQLGTANTLSNLGYIYSSQNDTLVAMEYYQKALTIQLEINDSTGQANSYNNIGAIQFKLGNMEKSRQSFNAAYTIYEHFNSVKGMAHACNNIGRTYTEVGEYEKGLDFYLKAYEFRKSINHKSGLVSVMHNIASAYDDIGETAKARQFAEQGLVLAQELGFPENIRNSSKLLSVLDEKEGRFEDAYAHYKLHIHMRDSIQNEETTRATDEQLLRYEFDKEQAKIAAETAKANAVRDESEKWQDLITWAVSGALLLALIFGIIALSRLKLTRRQKSIIEVQKQSVETQKEQLEETHKELGQRNKEVMDSINYAQRIQQAFLKNEYYENGQLPEHFILYKPKDIVSGDFYWVQEKQGFLYLATADCTGHGVPGAFLTLLGTTLLNEIMSGNELLTPGEVLDQLRTRIINELGQTGAEGETKDGMDMSLIRINIKTKEAVWAGANNGLLVVGEGQYSEFKPNKQPIGFHSFMEPFTNHEITLNEGQAIYMYSDGFQDQFGGTQNAQHGKKYMSKKFKEKLISIAQKSMENQLQLLDIEFEAWRGDLEQVDDVCVLGLRI